MVSSQGLWSLSRCLLVGIQSRGRDAAGYAYVTSDGRTNFAKAAVESKDFIKIPGHLLFEAPPAMPTNMLLHARYATQGEPKNNKNNHPLYSKISGLCMIHNGWFVNDAEVREQFSLRPDAEVDTETYLRLIEKFYIEGDVKSIETAIREATKCVFGNVVCGMIQGGKPNIMYLWRDRGDLAALKTEWGYVFASTMSILINAIGCLSAFDLAYYERFQVPSNSLVKFELGKKPKMITLSPIDFTNNKYSSKVSLVTINGEEKVHRVRQPTIYYYGGDYADYKTYFNGYEKDKRSFLPNVSPEKSGESNYRTKETTNTSVIKRPQTHHFECRCTDCTKWWSAQEMME